MSRVAEEWIEQAEYDLETAEHVLSTGRYLYVIFLCHLAIEKVLKAAVAEVTGAGAAAYAQSHPLSASREDRFS